MAIADLKPNTRNARTHSEAQIADIAKSIARFGFNNPVLIDAQRGIIAGHGRVLAAQSLGFTHVPTIAIAHLGQAEKRAYVLADNKLALKSGWDSDLLRLELGALAEANLDLALTGFDDDEIGALLTVNEDGAPAPGNYVEQYGVIVVCSDERDQARVYQRLIADGLNCRVVTT